MSRLCSHPREYRKQLLANYLCIGFVPGGNWLSVKSPANVGTLGPKVGVIERGVLQAYVRARASSATLCSVQVLRGSFSVFSIPKIRRKFLGCRIRSAGIGPFWGKKFVAQSLQVHLLSLVQCLVCVLNLQVVARGLHGNPNHKASKSSQATWKRTGRRMPS